MNNFLRQKSNSSLKPVQNLQRFMYFLHSFPVKTNYVLLGIYLDSATNIVNWGSKASDSGGLERRQMFHS